MEAIISGQLGTAALIENNEAELVRYNGETRKVSLNYAYNLSRIAADAIYLKSCNKIEALNSLELNWKKDRALLYLLNYVDIDTDDEERTVLEEKLNEWLKDKEVFRYVRSVTYSSVLPKESIISEKRLVSDSIVSSFVKELYDNQTKILFITSKWEKIAYKTGGHEKEFKKNLIILDVFYRLVNASRNELNKIQYECLHNCQYIENYRTVISEFIDEFIESTVVQEEYIGEQVDIFDESVAKPSVDSRVFGQKPLKVTQDHIDHVANRLKIAQRQFNEKNIQKADKTIEWLVQEQLDRGDNEFAAKSLCNASEMAKCNFQYDLQLKYALKAHDVFHQDARISGHIADAYYNLGEYDEAFKWFEQSVVEEADDIFGNIGKVRVLKRLNKLERALELSNQVLETKPENRELLILKSEILRGLRRYDEAIDAYENVKKLFPYDDIIYCSLAATYADNHDYEKSIKEYELAIEMFSKHPIPYTGLGHLLARFGELKEALPYLREGIRLATNKEIAINALASAYRINSKIGKAIKILEVAVTEFSDSEVTWGNLIQCMTLAGKYSQAKLALDKAITFVGFSSNLKLEEIKILSASGNNTEAMNLLDSYYGEEAFSSSEYALEKSRLLRKINKINDAEEELRSLIKTKSFNSSIEYEATLLGLLQVNRDLIDRSLRYRKYATFEDWNYGHASSINLVREKNLSDARKISTDGKKSSPFRSLRKKYCLILGIIHDLQGRTGSVVNAIKGFNGLESIILRATVYWKLGVKDRLERSITQLRSNRGKLVAYSDLIDELLNYFQGEYKQEVHGDKIKEIESEILLMAF